MKLLTLFALTISSFVIAVSTAKAATYTDRSAFLGATSSIGTPTTINFSTKDDGSPITNPSSDVYFENLTLSGVNFRQSRSYFNLFLYNFPNSPIRVELPPGTFAVGADITDFYDAGVTYTVALSTGETFSFPPPSRGWEFFGVISDVPIESVSFNLTGDYLALDNFTFIVNPVTTVSIDIKPGSADNPINLNSNGTTPVAILKSTTFDPRHVDPTTVIFAGAPVKRRPNGRLMSSVEDVNGDGMADLVLHFTTRELQLSANSTSAVLEGKTWDGTDFRGSDTVIIVP